MSRTDATLRTITLTTKVNEAEYAELAMLGPLTGDWLRWYLLDQVQRGPLEEALRREVQAFRAEQAALRVILLNTVERLALGLPITTEIYRTIIACADREKPSRP